jgi:dihydroneopterin aldolase
MLSSLKLKNAVFYAYHGVFTEEHNLGRKFEVDAELFYDFTKASQTDKLEDAINYVFVYRYIHDILTANKFFLVEKISCLIAEKLLEKFDNVSRVVINVRKCDPPVGGLIDNVEAKIDLKRSDG